jgi:hypothetical protein
MLKVVHSNFTPQYKRSRNNEDALRYDIAYLELEAESNQIVEDDQLVKPYWNWP